MFRVSIHFGAFALNRCKHIFPLQDFSEPLIRYYKLWKPKKGQDTQCFPNLQFCKMQVHIFSLSFLFSLPRYREKQSLLLPASGERRSKVSWFLFLNPTGLEEREVWGSQEQGHMLTIPSQLPASDIWVSDLTKDAVSQAQFSSRRDPIWRDCVG